MKQTVSRFGFIDAFKQAGREDNFSISGRRALYEWLEDIDCDYELDVIALCCEFSEYGWSFEAAYEHGFDACDHDDENAEEFALEWLHENTSVIEFDGGIIICDF